MKNILICSSCGQPTLKVKDYTVKSLIKNELNSKDDKVKWQVCVNHDCETIYLNKNQVINIDQIEPKVYFKDKTDNALICYCYQISRGDIKKALSNGCETKSEIYKYLKASKKGSCERNNPFGKSCSTIFEYELKKGIHTNRKIE